MCAAASSSPAISARYSATLFVAVPSRAADSAITSPVAASRSTAPYAAGPGLPRDPPSASTTTLVGPAARHSPDSAVRTSSRLHSGQRSTSSSGRAAISRRSAALSSRRHASQRRWRNAPDPDPPVLGTDPLVQGQQVSGQQGGRSAALVADRRGLGRDGAHSSSRCAFVVATRRRSLRARAPGRPARPVRLPAAPSPRARRPRGR